jgi:hypothetical protein
MKVIIPDEGYYTWWMLLYLMKVILPDEGYYNWWRLFKKPVMCTKFDIYVFKYYHLVDTSAGGLLGSQGIIHSVISALALI